jgi:hypothetical protein
MGFANARSLIGRILTQNRYPLLLNGLLLAEFPQKRDSAMTDTGFAEAMLSFCQAIAP